MQIKMGWCDMKYDDDEDTKKGGEGVKRGIY